MLCLMKKSLTQDSSVISGREKMSMNCFRVWPWELCGGRGQEGAPIHLIRAALSGGKGCLTPGWELLDSDPFCLFNNMEHTL